MRGRATASPYLPNIPAFALAYLAVQRAGGVAVSAPNPTLTRDEVKPSLTTRRLYCSPSANWSGMFRSVTARTVAHVVVCEGSAEALPLCAWIDGGEAGPMLARRADDGSPALLRGRPVRPKGATLSVRNVVSNARLTVQVLRASSRWTRRRHLFRCFTSSPRM
ncbi:MAG: hypothetical protein U1E63_08030 [Burkholderiales bacterium]